MSRIKDPAFYELRQKPLPTLSERRRFIQEKLAETEAKLGRYSRLLLAQQVSKQARALVKTAKADVDLLCWALAYLGEPDPRLDLYRLFGMDLPPRGWAGIYRLRDGSQCVPQPRWRPR
jgi:hypothetical protein